MDSVVWEMLARNVFSTEFTQTDGTGAKEQIKRRLPLLLETHKGFDPSQVLLLTSERPGMYVGMIVVLVEE